MHLALFSEFSLMAPASSDWLALQWQSISAVAGSTLITSIWQGAVIVCLLEIATRLMPRISAAHRFVLWSAGFLLSVALPLLPLLHFGADPQTLASSSAIAPATPQALLQLDERWGFVIAALWMLASLIRMASLAIHSVRLRQLWKTAQPVEVSQQVAASLNNAGATRVTVCTTKLLDRPSVIGFFAPRILIPEWLLSRLTPAEFEQILLHEAEHLRRRDDWTNLLQKVCLIVFPLNPALAWMEHHLCREREMACDEGVVRITNSPRAYAACLASLAERRLERRAEALSLGAWHRRSELVQRVHRILLRKRTMSRTAAGAVLATFGSLLFAGSVEMSQFPQLVAFVPRHNIQALTPARQMQLDALLAHENNETKLALSPSYRAVPANATLPTTQPSVTARVHKRFPSTHSADKQNVPSAQQTASVETSGDRVISAQPPIPQQWIVVAAWEEVSTVSRVPQTISDFATESEADNTPKTATPAQNAASQTAGKPAESMASQNHSAVPLNHSTVTQLILRVVPASPSSNSRQPAIVPMRDGWFVIQL